MPKQQYVGVVVSKWMPKTAKVRVARQRTVPKVGKKMQYHKNFMSHDAHDICQPGDVVRIQHCLPKSPTKKFEIIQIVAKNKFEQIKQQVQQNLQEKSDTVSKS